jgi:ribosomal protein S18 acetylase RimI-like enzyme
VRAEDESLSVRKLRPDDAEAFTALRLESLREEPLAFLSAPDDERAPTVESVRKTLSNPGDSAIFGAFDPALCGCVGIYRDTHRKAHHKAFVWGLYVQSDARRRGLAAALMQAALEFAADLGVAQVQLGVAVKAEAARRLYDSLGFEVWGNEPDAIRHRGQSVAEQHMILFLPDPSPVWGPSQ